jgi:hypothetical protein
MPYLSRFQLFSLRFVSTVLRFSSSPDAVRGALTTTLVLPPAGHCVTDYRWMQSKDEGLLPLARTQRRPSGSNRLVYSA